MAGSWCFTQILVVCAFCHAVAQWSKSLQDAQALMIQQTDQQFQLQKPVQLLTNQQFPPQKPVQQLTNQQFPPRKPVQQLTNQQFLLQKPVPQPPTPQFPLQKPVPQQPKPQFPIQKPVKQQFQKPVVKAESLNKCAVADSEQIQCGLPGIRGAECEAINCCFNGQQCFYGRAVTVQCIRDGQFVVVVSRDVTLPRLSLDWLLCRKPSSSTAVQRCAIHHLALVSKAAPGNEETLVSRLSLGSRLWFLVEKLLWSCKSSVLNKPCRTPSC
ncbi:uncharacterized protein LOC113064577 [Carassius auratus]|uniref:Uncharacterized protein LOC113064577 n=1 Tax=Carassius auratus TaxID=7957 RepID=A0A6P6M4R8_CARAU|nr:uncharacterized protein LOC113064577 [Carassius auratus]